jgi:Flp pilus assembly protein TadD
MTTPSVHVFARATALLCVLSCAACAGSNRSIISAPDQTMSPSLVRAAEASGDAAANAGQFAAAAGLYERAYNASPSPELAVRWGRSLRLAGNPQAGFLALKDVAQRYGRNADVLTELGRCAASGGYRQEASDAFVRALAAPGAGWSTYMADGAFEATSGSQAQAAAMFSRALATARTDRERYDAMANIAFLKAQNGDLNGGLAEMKAVVAHPGIDPKVHADLALLDVMAGDREGYAQEISQAGLPPDNAASVVHWLDGGNQPLDTPSTDAARHYHPMPRRTSPKWQHPIVGAIHSAATTDKAQVADKPAQAVDAPVSIGPIPPRTGY